MTHSPREILEESSSFRPSLEKEKIVVEEKIAPCVRHLYRGLLVVNNEKIYPLIGKQVRVTIEEIE